MTGVWDYPGPYHLIENGGFPETRPAYFLFLNSFLILGSIPLRSISAMMFSNSPGGAAGGITSLLAASNRLNSFSKLFSNFLFQCLIRSPPRKLYNSCKAPFM